MLLPYNVILDPNTGFYNFTTDHNIIYFCRFTNLTPSLPPVLGVYDIEILDFEFYPYYPHRIKKSKDSRIAITIIGILKSFFSNPFRVLIYVCDASDGLNKERQLLFKLWHKNFPVPNRRYQLDIQDDDGNLIAHGAVLTRLDFPYPDVLQTQLLDQARGIILEKFGQ